MTYDFRASQVRTNKIISSGSTGTNAALLIYPFASALNQSGSINTAVFATGSIGSDVFLFVSGAVNSMGTSTQGTALFGGDLKVSGAFMTLNSIQSYGSVIAYSGLTSYGTANFLDTVLFFASASSNGVFTSFGPTRLVGATQVTGTFGVANTASFTAPVTASAALVVTGRLSASLQTLSDGTPFLRSGPGITITTQSNGAVAISGSSSPSVYGRLFAGGYLSTLATSSNPAVAGQNQWSPTEWNISGSSAVIFKSILSSGGGTAYIKLYNTTVSAYVHIGGSGVTTLSTTSSNPTKLESINLASAINFYTDTPCIYEVQIYSSAGSVPAILGSAEFLMSNT